MTETKPNRILCRQYRDGAGSAGCNGAALLTSARFSFFRTTLYGRDDCPRAGRTPSILPSRKPNSTAPWRHTPTIRPAPDRYLRIGDAPSAPPPLFSKLATPVLPPVPRRDGSERAFFYRNQSTLFFNNLSVWQPFGGHIVANSRLCLCDFVRILAIVSQTLVADCSKWTRAQLRKALLKERGSMAAVARRAGVTPTTVSGWLRNRGTSANVDQHVRNYVSELLSEGSHAELHQ